MEVKLSIPACINYIVLPNGEPDHHRIFNVMKTALYTKYKDAQLTDDKIWSFLRASSQLPSSVKLSDIDTGRSELCFNIITQYKISAICQLCPYSTLYKNANEVEESLILCYALDSVENFKMLTDAGLESRHLRSMQRLSDKSKTQVYPINRQIYEFLKTECVPSDFYKMLDQIVTYIKTNSPSKLLIADLKMINQYIKNICNLKVLKSEDVVKILQDTFSIQISSVSPAVKSKKLEDQKPIEGKNEREPSTGSVIEGLLGSMPAAPSPKQSTPEPAVERTSSSTQDKNEPKEHTVPDESASKECKTAKKSDQKASEQINLPETNTNNNQNLEPPVVKQNKPDKATSNRVSANSDTKEVIKTSIISTITLDSTIAPSSIRKPIFWVLNIAESYGYPLICADAMDAITENLFVNDLLLTPLLPCEVVTLQLSTGSQESILLFTGKRFYYFDPLNDQVWKLLVPYIQKSSYRTLISYEPYLTQYFLNQAIKSNVISSFSLRIAADALEGHFADPVQLIHEILNKVNTISLPEIIFCMLHYRKLYLYLNEKLLKLNETDVEYYRIINNVEHFIGITFKLSSLFQSNEYAIQHLSDDYFHNFAYNRTLKPTTQNIILTIKITPVKNLVFPIHRLLSTLYEVRISMPLLLLSFSDDNLIIAINSNHNSKVTDFLFNTCSSIASEEDIIPVHISIYQQ